MTGGHHEPRKTFSLSPVITLTRRGSSCRTFYKQQPHGHKHCSYWTLDEWDLTKELVIVTDNAGNMAVAAELAGHTLNLASQRELKIPAVARLLGRVVLRLKKHHSQPRQSVE